MTGAVHDYERVLDIIYQMASLESELEDAVDDAEMDDELSALRRGRLTLRQMRRIAELKMLRANLGRYDMPILRRFDETVDEMCVRCERELLTEYFLKSKETEEEEKE